MSDITPLPDLLCIDVALDVPIRQTFSYLVDQPGLEPGVRLSVPFGRRKMVGIMLRYRASPPPQIKLRKVEAILDERTLFSASLVQLIDWTARYYHHPQGEVWRAAIPAVLRKGCASTHGLAETYFQLDDLPADWSAQAKRAVLQRKVIEVLLTQTDGISSMQLSGLIPTARNALPALLKKSWVTQQQRLPLIETIAPAETPRVLTPEQSTALKTLREKGQNFHCSVLEGITGSGKTEVYFALIDDCLAAGLQSLVMVPEIALTDQLLSRFRQRFGSKVVRLHSGMSDVKRHRAWWQLSTGAVDIVLATRSGVFQEFKALGLIVVDEEHDISFKQQEGLRYHARSLAIKRAQLDNIPIVLGSATLALETFRQVQQQRYTGARLSSRIGDRCLPTVEIIDLNQHRSDSGISSVAINALGETLARGEQSLVFINRRGYAPVLYCASCRWTAQCQRCDAQMTVHAPARHLQCHHCGAVRGLPQTCDDCGEANLVELGQGTQKIEELLGEQFPDARIQRFDRDNLSTANKLQQAMDKVHAGEIDILVGTQLLAKGHDFAGVSLVLVINADQGLHSIDFRAPEQLVQQLIQVAGRAGRGTQKGRVLIQSYFPDHPYLQAVKQHDYRQFVIPELEQRELAGFPPYAHLALWRARAGQAEQLMQFLQFVARAGRGIQPQASLCFDPVESPMFKRGGQYHAQLLVSAQQRSVLHGWLSPWIDAVERDRQFSRVRWSIDIDPVSLL